MFTIIIDYDSYGLAASRIDSKHFLLYRTILISACMGAWPDKFATFPFRIFKQSIVHGQHAVDRRFCVIKLSRKQSSYKTNYYQLLKSLLSFCFRSKGVQLCLAARYDLRLSSVKLLSIGIRLIFPTRSASAYISMQIPITRVNFALCTLFH